MAQQRIPNVDSSGRLKDKHMPSRLLAPALSNTYAAFPGNRAAVLGNSIDISQEAPAANSRNSSWFNYASIYSKQRFEYGYNAGIAGENTGQMLARFDTQIAPRKPRVVVIGGAENDAGSAVPMATYIANMQAMATKTHQLGAALVLRTALPRTTSDTANKTRIASMNAWLRDNSSALGAIALLDFYKVLVNPTTGDMLAAYDSGDGIHPNDLGNALLGKFASDTLSPLLPAWSPTLPTSIEPAGVNLIQNPLFTGALTNGVPSGWDNSQAMTGTGVVTSLVAGEAGNKLRFTLTNNTVQPILAQGFGATALRGHTVLYAARVSINLTAGQVGSFEVASDVPNDFFTRSMFNMRGVIADGIISVRAVVPNTVGYINIAHNFPAGMTGTVDISQVGFYDLTALGVV